MNVMFRRFLPVQYSLLLELFSKLSDRQEYQLGRADISRNIVIGMFSAMVALANLIVVFGGHPPLRSFVTFNYVATSLVLFMSLVGEAVNTFLNPVEMSVLAHQPIRDGIYFAAKMTYLATVVATIIFPLNLVPALLGLHVQGARWYFPLSYLISLYLFGFFIALVLCAIMGFLFRIFGPARLRGLASWMQAATFGMIFILPRVLVAAARFRVALPPLVLAANPMTWFLAIATAGQGVGLIRLDWVQVLPIFVCALLVVSGIRALSEGYMTKVHTLLHSGHRGRRSSRALIGPVVRLLTGSPSGRAAFSFMYAMARTDWQFRIAAMPLLIQILALPLLGIIRGLGPTPFAATRPTPAHILPHIAGMGGLAICSALGSSNQHKAAWIFLTAPLESIRAFVRGIFWALWFPLSIVALLLLPLYIWNWGVRDAFLFFAYSLALGAFYVSVELFLVDGLPFANPPTGRGGFLAAPLVLGSVIAAFIIMLLQWLFIFQDRLVALGTVFVFAGSAYVIAKTSLRTVEINVLHNLHIIASGRTAMFKELE